MESFFRQSLQTHICLIFISISCIFLVPARYWMDWDTLMYAINVRVHMAGDGSFSYMHNLIKNLLLNSFSICRFVYSDCQFIDTIRWITLTSLIISSFTIFFTIKELTNNNIYSFSGSLFWLLLPGNITLVHLYEDNVWAASFTCVFLYSIVKIHRSSFLNYKNFYLWSLSAATSLALGINLHQQLGLLFYLFLILIITHYHIKLSRKITSFILFFLWYLALSAIQNLMAFGQPYLEESITRLYHNPYTSSFPDLWFFSSGKAPLEWATLIYDGWRKTLFFHGRTAPISYYFIILSIPVFMITAKYSKTRHPVDSFPSDFAKQQAWFSLCFLIFIPYSLLYEPQNIERWDSVLPGLTIFIFSTLHHLMKTKVQQLSSLPLFSRSIHICLLVIMSMSCIQAYSFTLKKHEAFNKDSTTVYLSKILSILKDNQDIDSSILLLSEGFRQWDTDSQILLNYPSLQIITLQNRTLKPVHTSYPLQNKNDIPKIPINNISFPKGTRFLVTPGVYNDIVKIDRAFITNNTISVLQLH